MCPCFQPGKSGANASAPNVGACTQREHPPSGPSRAGRGKHMREDSDAATRPGTRCYHQP